MSVAASRPLSLHFAGSDGSSFPGTGIDQFFLSVGPAFEVWSLVTMKSTFSTEEREMVQNHEAQNWIVNTALLGKFDHDLTSRPKPGIMVNKC